MENKNFLDILDGNWGDIISSTYTDTIEQPIIKITFLNFDSPNKLELQCNNNTYKFEVKDNIVFNLGLCEIDYSSSNLDGSSTSDNYRMLNISLSKFKNYFLIVDGKPLEFKEEDLEEIYEKFDMNISLVDNGNQLNLWTLNINKMLVGQNNYDTFIIYKFSTFEKQEYIPETSVNQINSKFYNLISDYIDKNIGNNPSNYCKQYKEELKKYVI